MVRMPAFIAGSWMRLIWTVSKTTLRAAAALCREITADQPYFDDRIRPGVSLQRLGMILLKQEGVLELLERSPQSAEQEQSARSAVKHS